MPSSALTRFLKQGLARGMCPLCRVAHKLEREYIWYFFDEYSSQEWALAEVRLAGGFCAEHAEALRRVEGRVKTPGAHERAPGWPWV